MIETGKITKLANGWKYVAAAYITFAVMVLGICGTASMVFHAGPLAMRILSDLCAWSPTMVLFLGFKKWNPGQTRKEFFKKMFEGKIRMSLFVISILSTGAIFFLAVLIFSCVKGTAVDHILVVQGFPVIVSILLSVFAGPTGEECGWRGFLRPVFEGRYGFLKGNIITGLVWTFWHTVLWAVDNEFTSGMDLLLYVLSNVIVITSIHMIMAVLLEKENNLIYAVLVHLFFNLPYTFLNVDITFYVILMVLYPVEAAAFLLYRKCKK